MASEQRGDPGPSEQNTAELSKISTSSKNNTQRPPTSHAQIEERQICNDGTTEERRARGGWLRHHVSRLSLDTRYRIDFTDPLEPLDVAGKSKIFCGFKLFFDPTLPGHYNWLGLVSLAILYNLIFIIARAVFWELNNVTHDWIWYVLDYLCDAIYLVDTIVNMHEGYIGDQGLIVEDVTMLRKHYFKSATWRYDFISLLPTDLTYFWWAPGSCGSDRLPCPVIVRLNRLARLPRMWEWFERTKTATSYPLIFKLVTSILILIHWNACFYFSISYEIGFGTVTQQYIYSFWSTLTLTTITETIQSENDAKYLLACLIFSIAILARVLIFATIVASIAKKIILLSNMYVARVEFQNKIDSVKRYMAFHKISGELEERVIRWSTYTWAETGALDEEKVLSSKPDRYKTEIAIQGHLDTLRQVHIFQDCEPGLLEELVLNLKLQRFIPGEYIFRKGYVGRDMYIVKRGLLQVVADDGKTVLRVLTAGSVFGEISVIDIAGKRTGNRRTETVRTLDYSDLFCLAKKDLWETLADYPDARAKLIEHGCQLLRKDGLLDEAIFEKAQRAQISLVETVSKVEPATEVLIKKKERLKSDIEKSESEDRTSADETEI